MKRLLYILITLVAYVAISNVEDFNFGKGDCVCKDASSLVSSIDNAYKAEQLCCLEYNNDMLRTPRSVQSLGQNNNSQANNVVRCRVESHLKSISQAVPDRHAGHVTRIFEFNHFRSSLRITYYLYALCRLRI